MDSVNRITWDEMYEQRRQTRQVQAVRERLEQNIDEDIYDEHQALCSGVVGGSVCQICLGIAHVRERRARAAGELF